MGNIIRMGNDLPKFVEIIKLSKPCYRIMMANFTGTIIVDSLDVGLAVFDFLNPITAVFIHVF